MKKYLIILSTFIFYISHSPLSKGEAQAYEAWLQKEVSNSQIKVTACCKNNTSHKSTITMKISAEKKGKDGLSKITQSNIVILHPHEKKCLSQLILNFSEDDKYKITLDAYENNHLISTYSILKGKNDE